MVVDAYVDHSRNECDRVAPRPMIAIAEAKDGVHLDRVEKRPRLVSSEARVLPRFTPCFGPRTEDARLLGTICPVARKSKSIGIAAQSIFTVGATIG